MWERKNEVEGGVWMGRGSVVGGRVSRIARCWLVEVRIGSWGFERDRWWCGWKGVGVSSVYWNC